MEKFRTGEYIAMGLEKKVYEDPEDPDKVIGLYHFSDESAERIKRQFYLTKILHLLFSKNIPDIHLVTLEPHTVRKQRVETDEIHQIIQRSVEQLIDSSLSDMSTNQRSVQEAKNKIYANDKYIAFVRSMRDLGVSLDMSAVNFTFDKDGNIVYLDDIDPDGAFSIIKFSEEKFRQAINRILDKGIKRQSLHYLERYIELSKKHP